MGSIHKPFRHIVDDLKRMTLGIKGQPLMVDELKTGSHSLSENCDRFQLSFKIAENIIKWQVVFDKNEPELPPDVIFGPDDEDFCPELEDLKGYYDWDCMSESCLSKMLTNLISEYSIYQRNGISSLPGLNEQWQDLCDTTNYARNCEIFIAKNGPGTYNATASFMFEFSLDTSDLPPYLVRENVGDDRAVLLILFQAPNLTRITPRLYLSPRLENAVGGSGSLRIPQYGASDLKTYVEKIDILLANTVQDITERFARRKELIAGFLSEFHGAIIEYDASGFYEISLLLSHHNIFFILYVILKDRFPATPPVLVLQSVYHTGNNALYRQSYKDYPYSPRWDSKTMIEAIRKFLDGAVAEFKQESFRAGK